MALGRGMVMEVKGKNCIVLTSDGRFLKVPIPREGTDVGQEINVRSLSFTGFKPLMAVASLLVAVLAWFAFQMMIPAAAAYVAIDINPSIELGVNKKDIVISARGLNKDGELLLEKINLNNQPLEEGLNKIINQAIQCRYLSSEKDNLILATVTQTNQLWRGTVDINVDEIYDTMRQPINASGLNAELVVSETEPKVFKEAQKIGITPGRYIIQQEAAKKGIKINNQELRERKIRDLETTKKINAAECIKNANPGAVLGKSNQSYAKLPANKQSLLQQGNKKSGWVQKNIEDSPGQNVGKGRKGYKLNQTTVRPAEQEMRIERGSQEVPATEPSPQGRLQQENGKENSNNKGYANGSNKMNKNKEWPKEDKNNSRGQYRRVISPDDAESVKDLDTVRIGKERNNEAFKYK